MHTSDDSPTLDISQLEEELRSRLNVARAVLSARVGLRLTQAELAIRVGTKQARISEVENLEGNVRFDTLDRIARALGLEVRLAPRAAVSAGPARPGATAPMQPLMSPVSTATAHTALTDTGWMTVEGVALEPAGGLA